MYVTLLYPLDFTLSDKYDFTPRHISNFTQALFSYFTPNHSHSFTPTNMSGLKENNMYKFSWMKYVQLFFDATDFTPILQEDEFFFFNFFNAVIFFTLH